jgi:hypothetical protein
MNSSELLRIQVAGNLNCRALNNLIGPTGPTGPVGPVNPNGTQSFTILLDYGGATSISRVMIPPGLFTNPALSAGGVFTANVGTDLQFTGGAVLTLQNTTYAFLVGMHTAGYINAGRWQSIPSGKIGAPLGVYYNVTADYGATVAGLGLANINGSNFAVRPSTGVAAGFLASVVLFYM